MSIHPFWSVCILWGNPFPSFPLPGVYKAGWSNSKAMTAFGTARPDNGTTAAGLHANQKTMGAFALDN